MITFTLETITPEVATVYLQHNDPMNRKLRRTSLADYSKSMTEGAWQVTHQAIAFDSAGKLIDGQHRLEAIVKTGVTCRIYVARYDSNETAMKLSIDRNARRTISDVLAMDKRDVEIASFICTVMSSGANPSISEVESVLAKIQTMATILHDTVKSCAKNRSSSVVRAAVVCHMILNPSLAEQIAQNYRAFILLDFDGCSNSAKAFIKAFDNLSVRNGSDRWQVFSRAIKAFDPEKMDSKVNRFGNAAEENKISRDFVKFAIEFASEG
jgi:hypothetical protein